MTGRDDTKRVFRREGPRWLLLFTVWWVVVLTTIGAPHTGMGRGLLVLLVAIEALVFALAVLAQRSAVIVDDRGVTVRDLFRSRRFGWPEIDRIVVGSRGLIPGPIASIRLRDGRAVATPLWSGGLGFGNERTRRAIDTLAAELDARMPALEPLPRPQMLMPKKE